MTGLPAYFTQPSSPVAATAAETTPQTTTPQKTFTHVFISGLILHTVS